MEEDERRKQPKGTSLVPPQKTAEDDDDWDVMLSRYGSYPLGEQAGTAGLLVSKASRLTRLNYRARHFVPGSINPSLRDKSHSPIRPPKGLALSYLYRATPQAFLSTSPKSYARHEVPVGLRTPRAAQGIRMPPRYRAPGSL